MWGKIQNIIVRLEGYLEILLKATNFADITQSGNYDGTIKRIRMITTELWPTQVTKYRDIFRTVNVILCAFGTR